MFNNDAIILSMEDEQYYLDKLNCDRQDLI